MGSFDCRKSCVNVVYGNIYIFRSLIVLDLKIIIYIQNQYLQFKCFNETLTVSILTVNACVVSVE